MWMLNIKNFRICASFIYICRPCSINKSLFSLLTQLIELKITNIFFLKTATKFDKNKGGIQYLSYLMVVSFIGEGMLN